jgi:leader peptidase (prepilin peptidase) / N-methyltransferase
MLPSTDRSIIRLFQRDHKLIIGDGETLALVYRLSRITQRVRTMMDDVTRQQKHVNRQRNRATNSCGAILLELDWNTIFLVILAPFMGSFLATVVHRLPQDRSPAYGRSRCPTCDHAVGMRDLVPVLSWLVLRGRCRHCGAQIDRLYPVIEVAAFAIALWAAMRVDGWTLWVTCALGWTLLVLAAIDLRHYWLPNVLTVGLAVTGMAVIAALDPSVLWAHAIGAAAGLGSFAVIAWSYRRLRGREGLGMGDVKLAAAAGAWTSWVGLPGVVLWACLSAFLYALIPAARGKALTLQTRFAFGPHLCLGIWLVWLYGPLELVLPF